MYYYNQTCRSSLSLPSNNSLPWIHIKLLGTGTFGYVDHVRHPTEHTWEYARKTIKHNEKMDANGDISATAIREISILKTLDHPNVIKLIRVEYNLDKKDFLSFFLEMFPIDLKRYMDACLPTERLSSKLVQSYTYQILSAVDYLHRRAIIHRDIKPSNIVIDYDGHLKLADFGLARRCRIPERALTHEVVTLWYRPPEVLLNAPTYGMPLDIWGVGCVFAEMCLHRPLFRGECEIDQLLLIFRLLGTPSIVEWPDIANCLYYQTSFPNFPFNGIASSQLPMSTACRQLLVDMLVYNPQSRPTAKQLIEYHPYFTSQSDINLEQPMKNVIDRAIRIQTENMKNVVIYTSLSSECQSFTSIWTYYPCSFIISSSSMYCPQASISLSIDECRNREIMFFWHFPSGNMTITLESDNSFVLHLFKISIFKRNLIKSIYHVMKNGAMDNEILNDTENEMIRLLSNEDNACSIKFQTINQMIFDYGTFIRMTIMTNETDLS